MSNTDSTQRSIADQRKAGIKLQEELAEDLHQLANACRATADLISLCRNDVTDRHVSKILLGLITKLHDEARIAKGSADVASERADMLRWHQSATNLRRNEQ